MLAQVVVAESRRVCQLVALLEDEEVLRNETLLLLSAVAANNADLQQLMAFQGALERAWLVAESEGGCEGGGRCRTRSNSAAASRCATPRHSACFGKLC